MLVFNVFCQPNCTFSAILLWSKFAYDDYNNINNIRYSYFSPNRETKEKLCKYIKQWKTILIIICE